MTVFAPSLSSVWRHLEEFGVNPEPIFAAQGVEKATVYDGNARVPYAVADRIVSVATELTNDPDFGVREADYFQPAHLGALGFAWLASRTLQEALIRLQRYAGAISDRLEISLVNRGDVMRVVMIDPNASSNAYQRDTSALAVLVRMCRFLCGETWRPVSVKLAHVEPEEPACLLTFFACPVLFAADQNCIDINIVNATEVITGSDEFLAQLNSQVVDRYLQQRRKADIVNRSRVTILDQLGQGPVTEVSVAETLHLTPRQLHRKLTEENSSFRQLLQDCRCELAEHYLLDASLSLTEVAHLLGFSEASSFSRAFRRWAGHSPSQARAGLLAGS